MKKQIVALVLGVAVVGGVGAGIAANAMTSGPEKQPTATSGLVPLADLEVEPGAVGPVSVGMSKADAFATKYVVAGSSTVDGCPAPQLAWRKAYATSLDVYSLGNGEVSSIGIRGKEPRTEDGLGVGSTYADVRKVTDSEAHEAGYNQSGVSIYDAQGGGYVGFLFNEPVAKLTDTSKVTFVEVTKGNEPSLMRDGC